MVIHKRTRVEVAPTAGSSSVQEAPQSKKPRSEEAGCVDDAALGVHLSVSAVPGAWGWGLGCRGVWLPVIVMTALSACRCQAISKYHLSQNNCITAPYFWTINFGRRNVKTTSQKLS